MLKPILFSVLGSFLFALPASAATPILPCVPAFKGLLSLRFQFDKYERYHRTIRATLSAVACSVRDPGSFIGPALPEPALAVYGVQFSPELRERIAQAQHGADIYRPASVTAEFLASRLTSYTVEVNRELTQDYGHGFAAKVYRSWVAKQPGNVQAKDRLVAEMRRQLALSPEASVDELRRKSAGTVFAISLGLGWETEITSNTPPYVRDFIEAIRSLGVESVFLKRNALGTMAESSAAIQPQLKALLDSGKNVILIGLSKGAPEVLDAASRVVAPTLDNDGRQTRVPPGHGRIRASIMLSPLFGGLIASDFLESYQRPTRLLERAFGDLEFLGSRQVNQAGDFVSLLQDVTSPRVRAFTEGFWRKLPRDVTYLNASGVIAVDGLPGRVRDNAVGGIVEANRRLHLAIGANDGLIEFPGNLMPPGVAPRSESFLFTASHLLFDGTFDQFSLADQRADQALYAAFTNLALD